MRVSVAQAAPILANMRNLTRNALACEATRPKRSSWSRSAPRSERQSPPSASIMQRSRTTSPGSCSERRSRVRASSSEKASVKPTLSATATSRPLPACAASPLPSAVTSTLVEAAFALDLQGDPLSGSLWDSTITFSLLSWTFPDGQVYVGEALNERSGLAKALSPSDRDRGVWPRRGPDRRGRSAVEPIRRFPKPRVPPRM